MPLTNAKVPLPMAAPAPRFRVPESRVVVPVYVFGFGRFNWPVPAIVNPPLPARTLFTVPVPLVRITPSLEPKLIVPPDAPPLEANNTAPPATLRLNPASPATTPLLINNE